MPFFKSISLGMNYTNCRIRSLRPLGSTPRMFKVTGSPLQYSKLKNSEEARTRETAKIANAA